MMCFREKIIIRMKMHVNNIQDTDMIFFRGIKHYESKVMYLFAIIVSSIL